MDFIVFSHLRWNFVFQRPQHLISRCSHSHRVFFWEEPIFGEAAVSLDVREENSNLKVVSSHLPTALSELEVDRIQASLLSELISQYSIHDFVAWYYTPLALQFSRQSQPQVTVYDCMDELSAFRGAPAGLRTTEAELFRRADLVFTGGRSLYENKRHQHPSVHCFPSSIDRDFFASARQIRTEMPEQSNIPHPRLGYCGVIDERMDMSLIANAARSRPSWHFVMLGPVVKLAESELPQAPNIHYLGPKEYRHLPAYLSGWDVGLLPFALNNSTRFISPTKTPEYLAAGLPVISTAIADVIEPYGNTGLVQIAETPEQFIALCELALSTRNVAARLHRVDRQLSATSWDRTWEQMYSLVNEVVSRNYEQQWDSSGVDNTTAAD